LKFIGSVSDIKFLKKIEGAKYIGVDAEWKPENTAFEKSNGPAIIQLSSDKFSVIIDILNLKDSEELDKTLVRIFSNPNTTILGFGFSSDLSMFSKYCPKMTFLQNVPKFIDLQTFYKKYDTSEENKSSLAFIVEKFFGMKLCKGEQCSNWEKRPLRYSQEHYAALDAWILV